MKIKRNNVVLYILSTYMHVLESGGRYMDSVLLWSWENISYEELQCLAY